MRRLITHLPFLLLVLWTWALSAIISTSEANADFVPLYRGGICVADASGACVGGDIRAEPGLGTQVGYMKTTADSGTVPVYRSTCYSDSSGTCTAWGLSLAVNGTPVGYLSTTAPDTQSVNNPLTQSNGLLLQNLGGTASAYLWTIIPPNIVTLSPNSGPIGTPVTITGANFGAIQGTSTVTFNGVSATLSSWSDTSIAAPVPSGATTGSVIVTVAGSTSNGIGFTVAAGGGSNPTKLVLTSVNNGNNPTAGLGFPVIVQTQDESGAVKNVSVNTGVSLSLKTGTGILGGTLNGTISAGTNQVTLGSITYTKAEGGIVLTASQTSGDALSAGDSAGFTVNPGAATQLAFTTQPGNSTTGSALAGPPTVSVQDSFGNTVTASAASITIAIASNPGGGSSSGTTTRNASSGVAAFTGLSINQAGTGYSLSATSSALASPTSSSFNVTSTGGIIAGVITKVSNGTPISGALVEAMQGNSVVASVTTNSSGNYSIPGISTGTYTVRASFTGLVPQMLSKVSVTSGNTTAVNLSLNFGIAVQTPVAGATINDFGVLVTGLFDTSLAPEVGIQVNGYIALIDGNEFATFVPLDSQTLTLTATITDASGNQLAGDAVPITPQTPSSEPVLNFRPSPVVAFVAEPVSFRLTSLNAISQVQLDGNGDGTVDFTGTTLDGVSVTFAESGIYYPVVTVTEPDGTLRTATTLVQVLDMVQLDFVLTTKWNAMKNALRNGDTAGAADYIVKSKRAIYQNVFNSLTVPLANIDQVLGSITYEGQRGVNVEYEMLRVEGSQSVSYMVLFALDEDGVWRIKFF